MSRAKKEISSKNPYQPKRAWSVLETHYQAIAGHMQGREATQPQPERAQPPIVGPCFQCGKLHGIFVEIVE